MTVHPGLPKDWAYSPAIDLELKQYTLLGYLQHVRARFAERKLYPYLEQVEAHVNELNLIRRSKGEMARNIVGPLLGFDPRSGEAIRERLPDVGTLAVIDEVIEFAVPGLLRIQAEGNELKEELAHHIHFAPVGLQPLHATEGWFFLRRGKETRVYGYSIPFIVGFKQDLKQCSMFSRYVTSYTIGITCTYEHIKSDLILSHPALPNPATFVLETDLELPCIETFVPLAKRLVLAHVASSTH